MNIKLGKYRTSDGLIVEVLYVGDQSIFFRFPNGSEGSISISYAEDHWSEYKEPRTITFFVNIYEGTGGLPRTTGSVWETREVALGAGLRNPNYIDTMEVTWTEKSDG